MANQYFLLLLLFLSTIVLVFSNKIIERNSDIDYRQVNDDELVQRSMFPRDFLFGAATSAYQIEGGYLEDGKGLSNWDVFTHEPGNIINDENGDVATDHYHRYKEDIELMENLGVNSYRFSISWSRILPRGKFGEINPAGISFYNKIIDNLLLKGIEPFVTIHHFDYPQELEDKYGSWLSPLMQEDLIHFAKICFENFGDRVKHWATMNEPNIIVTPSYMQGTFPPGRCSPPFGNCSNGNSDVEPLIAFHNMLLSHAKVVKLYRDQFQQKQEGKIGIVLSTQSYVPYRDDNSSLEAVERGYAYNVAWVLDPLIYGNYPSLMRKYHGNALPKFTKKEVELIKGSVDFLGLNHYTTWYAIDCFNYSSECSSSDNRPIQGFIKTTGFRDGISIGEETGIPIFSVVPQGFELVLDYITKRYPKTVLYITENGYAPLSRSNNMSDVLQDYKRIYYLQTYMAALLRAIRNGANVKGYFTWSLMDNFEWHRGYTATFGLYHVNWTTLERTPKLSAKWFAGFLANNDDTSLQNILHSSM